MEKRVAKEWTKCVDNLTECYTPMTQACPERDRWTFHHSYYTYKSCAPISKLDVLNSWVESSYYPTIVGPFFVRESLDDAHGTYEAIPMSLLTGPIMVKRYVHKIYYKIGADADHVNDPGDEYKYHVIFQEYEGELDTSFRWDPEG